MATAVVYAIHVVTDLINRVKAPRRFPFKNPPKFLTIPDATLATLASV